jgi:thiamine-phosphate pyrophosphorylase
MMAGGQNDVHDAVRPHSAQLELQSGQMAARSQGTSERPAPRLYVVTPLAADAAAMSGALAAMVEAADLAAVLLRLADASEGTLTKLAKTLAPVVQKNGAALVLDGHPEIVGRSGADGAHLTGIEAFEAALPNLKPARIAGAGGLITRHDAMVAAEAGADYLMFGEPDRTGQRPPFEATHDRVLWAAELFEKPCVGYAANLDEVAAVVAAGADFVAIGDFAFADPSDPAAAVRAASRLLAPEPVR